MRFGVVLLSLVLCGSAAAESKDRPLIQEQRCLLQVDGKTYMTGRCQYWVSKEGDVMITGRSKLYPRLGPFKQGNVVWADPDVEAAWNGPFVERHAHDSLGKVTKRGDCWVNDYAKVCVPLNQTSVSMLMRTPHRWVRPKRLQPPGSSAAARRG